MNMKWTTCLTLVLFCLPGSAIATEAKPNVLVLISDDQRPDTIHALGNPRIQTPNLDALAKTGSVFTKAICGYPICTPSRAEILTGCNSFQSGVFDFGRSIDQKRVRWAQAMQAGGYHTCYVGKWHNDHRPGDHGYVESRGLFSGGGGKYWKDQTDHHGRPVTGYRGWIFQTDDRKKMFPERGVGLTPDISAKFADAAISLIEDDLDKPFFLHVNFTAPHDPLHMPPGYENKYKPADMLVPKNFRAEHPFDHGNFNGRDEKLLPWPRTKKIVQADLAVYYAVVSHLDEQVGRIVAALKQSGKYDNTIIIYSSDHGLAMGSHGLRGKQNMYEHTINVPMIFHGPGIPQGKKYESSMYLRDLYPTVCDLVGIPIPETVTGKSVLPILQGKTAAIYEQVFGYFRDSQRMVRSDDWKLIVYPQAGKTQLFDMNKDPLELHNLAGNSQYDAVLQQLKTKLHNWQKQVDDPLLKTTAQ